MARRRLQAILATTAITVGITAVPAMAQELPTLTDTVEGTLTQTTEVLSSVTDEVVGTVTEAPTEEAMATGTATSTSEAEPTPEPSEEPSSEDDTLLDVGTGDGTLDVDLDVDVAPRDEDGSPQLEIDGGVTVADQELDLGSVTDPIEDAVDPDPEPTGDTSSDQAATGDTSRTDGPGGFIAGGGVVAAGDDARPATTSSTSTSGSGGTTGSRSVGTWDGGSFGLQRYGGGTATTSRVPDPEVAPPAAAPQGVDEFAEFPEAPEVAEGSTPAVLATGMPDTGPDSPLVAVLRALAGALVLATGAAWTRATRDA